MQKKQYQLVKFSGMSKILISVLYLLPVHVMQAMT